jgi:hypothetical protein
MMFRSSGNPLRRAGASVSEIALSQFINQTVFETKLGDPGIILSLVGIDPDCRTDESLNAFIRPFESAVRRPLSCLLLYRQADDLTLRTRALFPP